MKTKIFIIASVLFCGIFKSNAQATQATNAITAGSYLGTSNNNDVIFKRQAVAAGLIATNKTSLGVNSSAMANSISIGANSGQYSSGFGHNTYVGHDSGRGNSASILNSGSFNTFVGDISGEYNTTGSENIFIGVQTGYGNTTGTQNVYLGNQAGGNSGNSARNVFLGHSAGSEFQVGNNNCFIGYRSGNETVGSNNVFLGTNTGETFQGSNRLLIDVQDTQNSLIWGDFANDQLKFNGKVGIGGNTTTGFGNYPTTAGGVSVSNYNLFVKGGILTEEVRVNIASSWADYVFNKDYNLKSLPEVEKFISANGHLPNVPSAAQVREQGIELGEMSKIQQEKIEELTLYIIQLNKKLEAQEKKIDALMQNK